MEEKSSKIFHREDKGRLGETKMKLYRFMEDIPIMGKYRIVYVEDNYMGGEDVTFEGHEYCEVLAVYAVDDYTIIEIDINKDVPKERKLVERFKKVASRNDTFVDF